MSAATANGSQIVGVMRPGKRVDLFLDAGFGWIRDGQRDWLAADGRPDRAAMGTLRRTWAPFLEAGVRIALSTPMPADVPLPVERWRDFLAAYREACRVAASELGDIVRIWQIGNEPNLWLFRQPLDVRQAVEFSLAGAEGILAGDPTARVGINPCCRDATSTELFRACYGPDAPIRLDYAGIDLYPGSYIPGGPDDLVEGIREVEALVPDERPVLLLEMGYSSRGEVLTQADVLALLASLGYASIETVRADPARFLDAAGPMLRGSLATVPASDFEDELLDICQHLLKKWRYAWPGHAHDEETQAAYMEAAIDRLLARPRLGGIFFFAWSDFPAGVPHCWRCGQADCPIETSLGLLDGNEEPKPAYHAVKRALARHGLVSPGAST